jgi:alkylhydroperoxidase/carboxymuconolactone decarboxylase family protein YurZ
MAKEPKPPEAYQEFVKRFPKIGAAWELLADSAKGGPLDERTLRLVKLAISMGALREGAVRAGVRKALAAGVPQAEIDQVIAASAATVGLPAAVAIFTWSRSVMGEQPA